jgi:hypothetical protein
MVASKTEMETRWIDAWSDLYELIGQRSNVLCKLPDGQVVDVEACKHWLQNSAYEGWEVKVELGSVAQSSGVIASRWRSQDGE